MSDTLFDNSNYTNVNTNVPKASDTDSKDILAEIIASKKKRIKEEGYAQGIHLPEDRDTPLIPFLQEPALICEIKHRSPSRGIINTGIEPVQQAMNYHQKGVKTISVLTEQDHFFGSLGTLRSIKQTFPTLALLRKDFIIDPADIQVSYRAGADAILLIASLHTSAMLKDLYVYAKELGLAVLVEVHSEADVDKIKYFTPDTVGINCRNLETFQIDRLHPLLLQPAISWNPALVYESGIQSVQDADFAYDAGFDAVLCGEAVMKNQSLVDDLLQSARGIRLDRVTHPKPAAFWKQVAAAIRNKTICQGGTPIVKICGLCSYSDVHCAYTNGATLLGFIFADSPRIVKPSLLYELGDIDALKVAVVSGEANEKLSDTLAELLQTGYIDAIQFHGSETPQTCNKVLPYYKALRPYTTKAQPHFGSPRILLDAWDAKRAGGTGKQVRKEVLAAWKQPLWLAGGLNSSNITECIHQYNPELVDVSSGVEVSPGVKDHNSIREFMNTIHTSKQKSYEYTQS